MGKQIKLTELNFKSYYEGLPERTKVVLRDKIVAELEVSKKTFYVKMNNATFKRLEMTLINQIITKVCCSDECVE